MNDPQAFSCLATCPRRRFLSLAGGLAAAAAFGPLRAFAAGYPDKPVRLLANFSAGGPLDILVRTLALPLQAELRQPFVVENRPGAGGNIGADVAARAPADGYTVLLSIDSTFTINPHLYASMPFRPQELRPLLILSSSGLTFGVAPSLGVKSLAEFIDLAKKKEVGFSSAGNGSPGHIAMEIFRRATGAKALHVPYKGNAPAVTALLAGEVEAGILATPGLLPHIQAGKVQALAVTGSQRSPLLPQVPAVGQLGLEELAFEVLYLALLPAATPDPVLDTLGQAFARAMGSNEVKSRLEALDMVALAEAGDAAAARLAAASRRYGEIVKSTGMKLD